MASSHTTSYKRVTTTISVLSNRKYRVKTSVIWDKMPVTRSWDVLGTGINSNQYAPNQGTEYAKQNWTEYHYLSGNKKGSATYSSSSPKWKRRAEGYGVKMNLRDNDGVCNDKSCWGYKVTALSLYAYYTVEEYKYNSQSRIDAYGQYGHATESIWDGISFSIGYGSASISFESNSDDYDISSSPHAYIYI